MIPWLTRIEEVASALKHEGCVLHAPSVGTAYCELTKPNETYLYYKCHISVYTALFRSMEQLPLYHNGTRLKILHVYLEEPGCGGGWALVHESNFDALLYRIEPPKAVPLHPITGL